VVFHTLKLCEDLRLALISFNIQCITTELSATFGSYDYFQAPTEVELDGLVLANDYKEPCPQKDKLTREIIGSEDCLNLNIFTPNVQFQYSKFSS